MIAALAAGGLVVVIAFGLRPRPARLAALAPEPARDRAGPMRPIVGVGARRGPRRRHRVPEPSDIGEWCGRLAAACRSGATLSAAVRNTEPPATAAAVVDELRHALDRGRPLVEIIDDHTAGPHLDVALTVLRACASSGAPAAEPLDRAAAALRGRAAEAADRSTHSAQARLSALVMTLLPVAMLAVLLATSHAVRGAVITPVGLACTIGGALLNVAGWWWMRRIIDRSAR